MSLPSNAGTQSMLGANQAYIKACNQHVSNNTQGIPGNAQQRCVSEASAWRAFTDALDANRVIRVTMHLQEERLTRAHFNL
ncbi:hypothetical protein H0H92_000380 [Tricholoma furcatifolium]|nr:hypothetical protein H0H92_000380 [Tricholoma furcatifolium]